MSHIKIYVKFIILNKYLVINSILLSLIIKRIIEMIKRISKFNIKTFSNSQVCGSMPYDDSNIKKMIRAQTERRVAFSRSRNISGECKDVIHKLVTPIDICHIS